jgi:hypothetical protein
LFKERHKAYGDVIDDLNVLLNTLNEKGTGQVTIGAMKNLNQSKIISKLDQRKISILCQLPI